MTGRSVLYSIALYLLLIVSLSAQNFGDGRVNSLILSAFDSVKNGDYTAAAEYFDTLEVEFPQHAIGKLYKAGITILEDYVYVLGYDPDSLYGLIEEAVDLAEEIHDNNPDSLLAVYQHALALGLKGYYDALQQNYFSALTESIYSLQYFHECLEIDPTAYDSYVALGSYKFWVSTVGKEVLYLPFIEDERELGITYLKLAIEKNTYHSYAAIHSLAYAYNFSKDYDKTVELLETILNKHPGNKIFGIILGDTYLKFDYEKAIIWYEKMFDLFANGKIKSKIREVELLHKLAYAYNKLNKNDLALNCCNNILSYDLNDFEENHLSGRLEKVINLREMLISVAEKGTE